MPSASRKAWDVFGPLPFKHDREQAARAREIALPDRVVRMAFERRIEHLGDPVLLFQPARDLERALLVPLQPDAHRAQAAQHLVDVVGSGAAAERVEGLRTVFPSRLRLPTTVPSSMSECPAGYFVAAWIDDVHAEIERPEIEGVAQVLSSMTIAPPAWAAATIAGMSWTSNVLEAGDSVNTTLVFGFINAAMPAPIWGS